MIVHFKNRCSIHPIYNKKSDIIRHRFFVVTREGLKHLFIIKLNTCIITFFRHYYFLTIFAFTTFTQIVPKFVPNGK